MKRKRFSKHGDGRKRKRGKKKKKKKRQPTGKKKKKKVKRPEKKKKDNNLRYGPNGVGRKKGRPLDSGSKRGKKRLPRCEGGGRKT